MGIDTYYNVAYPDTAADKISPVTKAIEEMSSTERLCKGSFNGHSRSGIGRPKAYANYFVQDTPDLSQKISADAKSAGLELHQDPDNSNKQYNWRLRSYDASKNEFLSSSSEMQPFKFEDEYLLVEIVRADRIGNPCSIGVVDVPAGKAYVSLDYESKKP